MDNDMIMIQHRMTDQILSVPLSRYRSLNRGRYRNWKLHGQSPFIAPPELTVMAQPVVLDKASQFSALQPQTGASTRE
jgi:hypothetical protein